MYHQPRTFFGDIQKALAQALYDAGQSDTEIGLGLGVSVNNIVHWRREVGLRENSSAQPEAMVAAAREPVRRAKPVALGSALPSPGSTAREIVAAAPATRPQAVAPPAAAFSEPSVQPAGDNALEIGTDAAGRKILIDLEELLTTRLLVQGNSGSGKSHLLRKVIEESTGIIQQVIIDPEGDFVSLAETFGHTVIDADAYDRDKMAAIGARVRQHRGSVVLNLEELDAEQQMDRTAAFLEGLFDAPREHWYPALVFVDEAQLFAPSADNGEDREVRKASLLAMTNLMCRGRKRGLAGVMATQRLAKLHKNVAAEASNFLMGRTFLDIDIARAGDLLGLKPQQAEQIRDLARGEFLGLGPAISRRPLKVRIGDVLTQARGGSAKGLVPLPNVGAPEMKSLMLTPDEDEPNSTPALRIVK